ncbi:YhcN/YlaJ family sporulation lipoprotein [Paenibacillus sp. N4]|uniref:YhcN/YlaJ family sporulation lipoprotein n=1 Tax=Paenibacillus vietnamensis TaxID=2590547 RepID=UPI001CD13FC2|nr:YhcN/YlaJ family sporulation lipoprotein [Paenibacillus vietnamensis]MCA0754963.1 YhcN/YlaJ family sporulation lipoprotein [Paenibacillus vietnamensis]
MRKRIMALSAGVLLSTMLAGCSDNQGDLGNKNIRSNSIRYDANGNLLRDKRFANDQMNEMNRQNGRRLNSNNVIGSHKNYRLEMSDTIAESIKQMQAVKSCYVMLTDDNAYIAVSLDEEGPAGDPNTMSRSNIGRQGEDGVRLNKRMSGLSTGYDKLTDQIKDEIAGEVRRLRPDVNQVYVSANPDFVGRMNAYMQDVKLGHPIQGFVAEFNAMAERIFPAKAGDNSAGGAGGSDGRILFD